MAHASWIAGFSVEKEGCSFLKKRTKKLLRLLAESEEVPGLNVQKFFASFFQKRSPSLLPS